ncbi:MAG TPA: universal stress protein [Candidatus Polarisedimenticolia bacterium]|nr:universal stress protein [Candidatus Polarisedimenticolia bacterium]
MKIVLAYDGSRNADAAVNEVLNRAWPAGSEVRLVTAVPIAPVPIAAEGMAVYGPVWDQAQAAVRDLAHRRVREVLERFRARPDLKVSFELRDEPASAALLDVVRRWGADLLVLGSQGTTALGRLFVGSVCHSMVSHAPCTVEIVRPPLAA